MSTSVIRVTNDSMMPVYKPGEDVVADEITASGVRPGFDFVFTSEDGRSATLARVDHVRFGVATIRFIGNDRSYDVDLAKCGGVHVVLKIVQPSRKAGA